MSLKIQGVPEILFFRKMTALGALFLIAISVINQLFPTDIIDYPFFRIVLAVSAIAMFAGSFWSKFVRKHSDFILASLLYAHALSIVWSNYLNNFEIFDTSTSLVVGFALGAAFRKKEGLMGYLLLIACSYAAFFFHTSDAKIPTDYFLITLAMLIGLAWLVFSSRISALDKLEESQAKLMQSEDTFRNIFQWAPVGIVLFDMNLKAFRVNQIVLDSTGFEEKDVLGHSLEQWLQTENSAEAQRFAENLHAKIGNNCSIEQNIQRKDGRQMCARFSFTKMNSPSLGEYILAMVEDITFHKKASEKLREYALKLKQQNKALEEFSYVVSHDLQEPLRMIKSYTQIINRRYIAKLNNGEAEKDMYYVIDGAERMSTLVRDMLAYTRMSASALEKEPVMTQDVCYDVMKNLALSIKERNAAIYINELPEVQSNRVLFSQVVQNLIGNGLKYSSVQRDPEISVTAESQTSETVFCVKDNGVGFTEEDGKKIFGIFQRINKTAAREKGTGIGLAICQRIIEKHGGRIWAEGVPGEGAKFYFALPN